MKNVASAIAVGLLLCLSAASQVPIATGIQILKAEDARRYDQALENLLHSPAADIRKRAALAAGRIGDDKALPTLSGLLKSDPSTDVRAMAAFAIGEIESVKGAEAILGGRAMEYLPAEELARRIEAAGKIAAANPKADETKALEKAIVDCLTAQLQIGSKRDRQITLLALTAALRARPKDGDRVVAKFLTDPDPRIRADAENTLSRLRSKNANEALRNILATDTDAVARANAARALGAAEDKGAFDLLLKAAIDDTDSRVRVSAIRSLGALKDARAADALLGRGKALLGNYQYQKTENRREKNECLEIAATLGRLLPNTKNEKAVKFLSALTVWGIGQDTETAVAWATVDPRSFMQMSRVIVPQDPHSTGYDWRVNVAQAQGLAVLAKSEDDDIKKEAGDRLRQHAEYDRTVRFWEYMSIPDDLQALAAFKPVDLAGTARFFLAHDDVQTRATAAGIIADQPTSKENVEALQKAFTMALVKDKDYDDAQLAILDALFKLDKKEAVGTLLVATSAPDYLVRKKAFELLADPDLQKDFPGLPTSIENAKAKHKDEVLPYSPAFGTKLGQLLNTDADYRRALARRNGSVRAVIKTVKGTFTIEFAPEEAPLTVDNFIKLARTGYFNNVLVHRVVPNFVMQDGDPGGDGNGGPGWSIRCEVNMLSYDRGAVGMALSGKDTGGSQWFVTHAPQPHLDGGYTVFGHVSEADMKVVDQIARGDKIISVKIIGR